MTPGERLFADAFAALNRAMLIEMFGTDQQKHDLHGQMAANRKRADEHRSPGVS